MALLKRHSFADTHGDYELEYRYDWLVDRNNVCPWRENIPEYLKLDEPGMDSKILDFIEHHGTETGAIQWHMFCLTAYEYKMRKGVESIGVDKVICQINASGNDIFMVESAINPLKEHLPQISNKYAALYGRLFNYYHCLKLGRLELFKLSPRKTPKNTCPACGCIFSSSGFVIENPEYDVVSEEWSYEDKLEHGGTDRVDKGTVI